MAYPNTMFHSYQWLPTGAGFLPSTVWLLVKLRSESGPKNHRRPGRFTNDANRLLMPQPYCTLCHGQNLDYTHAYIYIYICIYGPAFKAPSPPGHGFGSAIVLCPSPPCGVVWYCPLTLPVVWWGCGTVPFPSLWCGWGVVLRIYIYMYLFIYI